MPQTPNSKLARLKVKRVKTLLRYVDWIRRVLIDYVAVLETVVSIPVVVKALDNLGGEDEKRFHIIGNSHAHSFTTNQLASYGKQDGRVWDSYSLGPLSSVELLGQKFPLLLKAIQKGKFRSGDYVLLPLGEAECRWYSLRDQANLEAKSMSEIHLLLEPYLKAAEDLIIYLRKEKFRPIVWGGQGSTRLAPREDPNMPIAGSESIRNSLSRHWHESCREFAYSQNIPFVSPITLMIRDDNQTDITFLAKDGVHMEPEFARTFLLMELNRLGIIRNGEVY